MNLSERDSKLIWHPFTRQQNAVQNIAITHGKDALLWDEQGNEYIDAVSSWWTNIFGHARPEIAQAIQQQTKILEHVIFAGFTHQPAIETAERLLSILPNSQKKVFFSDNGSTAVEVALKMAIQYWHNIGERRHKIIAFQNAYHGDTFGAMSVGARGYFNRPFESFLFDVEFIALPTEDNFETLLENFQQLIRKEKPIAFIFEPLVQGSAGMNMYASKYLNDLIKAAKENGVLCIADEVMTGFGRTGKFFASDYLSEEPDIFCLSKGVTGGFLPLGLTTCSQKVYEAFVSEDKMKTFFHGHSYTGNPLACAAAVASLKLLQTSKTTIEYLVQLQTTFKNRLQSHPKVEHLRQQGTIVAFEVKSGNTSNYFNDIRDVLYENFIKRGVLLRPLGNTVYILPPYVITEMQLQKVYEVIEEVLELI